MLGKKILSGQHQKISSVTFIDDYPVYRSLSLSANIGKTLFLTKCTSCHILNKDVDGHSLRGFEERGPWVDRKNIYAWIRNPVAFMKKDEYTRELRQKYNGLMMTGFPDLKDEEIDAICDYINESEKVQYVPIAKKE